MIKVQHLSKKYSKNDDVLKDINLEIDDKEFLVLLGESGCGKTTFLKIVAGLEEADSGDVYFDSVCVNKKAPKERNVSMVFQDLSLIPSLSVRKNISFGLEIRKVKKEERNQKVLEVAERLGLTSQLDKMPNQLSGGQQQRVAIARAIVKNPNVYLFDEPLSSLDANLRSGIIADLKKLHNNSDKPIIYVTHSQNEALSLGDRIAVMKDGKILQVDSPKEIYTNPNCLYVAEFLGEPKINKITIDDKYQLCLRPEEIKFGKQNDHKKYLVLKGQIEQTEFVGNGYIYHVKGLVDDKRVRVFTIEKHEEENVDVYIDRNKILTFENNGKRIEIDSDLFKVIDNKITLRRKQHEKE